MRVSLLGPVLAQVGDTVVELGGVKQRAVLAMLAMSAGKVVAMDRLIDDLWHDEPPARATTTLRAYVSRLRRALETSAAQEGTAVPQLRTQPPGWVLEISPTDVDVLDFHERLVRARRRLRHGETSPTRDELVRGRDELVAALGLWRGDVLADLRSIDVANNEAARTEDARQTAVELLLETRLHLGEHERVVDDARAFVNDHPFRERAWAALVLALYRTGRQSDALAAVAELRSLLLEELGTDPSPQIQQLALQVLRQAPSLWPGHTSSTRLVADTDPADSDEREQPGFAPILSDDQTVVGRGETLRLLSEAVEDSRRGRGRLVVLEAHAGIGKTTMLGALATQVQASGGRVVHGAGGGAGAMPALWSWVTVIRALAPSGTEGNAETGAVATAWALMGTQPGLTGTAPLDVTLSRTALYRGVVELVAAAHHAAPLTLVFDDLQWVDDETLTLLSLAVDELTPLGVLFAVGVRTEESGAERVLEALLRTPSPPLVRHRLEGLDQESVAALSRNTSGEQVSQEVVKALHEATAGNPLFLSELVRLLSAERRLDIAGVSTTLPDRVADVLRRRLNRLPDPSVQLMHIVAVARSPVDVETLASVAGLDADVVVEDVEPAFIAGLLVEHADGSGFTPSHDQVRQTLLLDLSRARRVRLHARLAVALQSRGQLGPEEVLEVAHHLTAAAPTVGPSAAIPYLLSASEDAISRYATLTAAKILEEALYLARQITSSGARRTTEHQVQGRLAMVRGYVGTHAALPPSQLPPPLPTDESSLHAWIGTVTMRAAGGQLAWARDVATAALRAELPPDAEAAAQLALGWTSFALGDLDSARPALARVLALTHTRAPSASGSPFTSTRQSAQGYLALIAHLDGADEAASDLLECARLACATEVEAVNLELYACLLAAIRGDAGDARTHVARMIELAEALEYPVFVLQGRVLDAWAAAMLGVHRDPAAMVRALNAYRSSGLTVFQPTYNVLLAEVHQHAEDSHAANAAIETGKALTRDSGEVIHGARLEAIVHALSTDHSR